jgi:hypothetical protein
MRTTLSLLILAVAVGGSIRIATAQAAGGAYVFSGGTGYERLQVHDALQASSFNWSIVPITVTIHIGSPAVSEATPGNIYLDASLLDAGEFSWGVVQHEYAHQVDFTLLSPADRLMLTTALGAPTWCYSGALQLPHAAYGCERFASNLAWAYWPSKDNCLRPSSSSDEAGSVQPAAFRTLLAGLLGPAASGTAGSPGATVLALHDAVPVARRDSAHR